MGFRDITLASSLLLLLAACGGSAAAGSTEGEPTHVELNGAAAGNVVALAPKQELDLTLQTIGPGNYEEPTLSSPVVEFLSMEYAPAAEQNPGGPKQVFHFRALAPGQVLVKIPHSERDVVFMLTLDVQ